MYQVFTMEHRYTREVLEGTIYQIEVIADAADTWIGMKTREYWVLYPCANAPMEKRSIQMIDTLFFMFYVSFVNL